MTDHIIGRLLMHFILICRLIHNNLVVLHYYIISPQSLPLLLQFRSHAQRPNEQLHLYNIGEIHFCPFIYSVCFMSKCNVGVHDCSVTSAKVKA